MMQPPPKDPKVNNRMSKMSSNSSLKGYWLRRRYNRLHADGTIDVDAAIKANLSSKKKLDTARLGDRRRPRRRSWKIKRVLKLRFFEKFVAASSPVKLWSKFKDGYMNMMLGLAGGGGGNSIFGSKRVPTARNIPMIYSGKELENRLVEEIYKALVASRELESISKNSTATAATVSASS